MDIPSKPHLVLKGGNEHYHNQKSISAASEVSPSRKKVLAERNDIIIDTHFEKAPMVGSESISSTRFGENMEKYECNDEVLSNSASPRPKYLRYKPNRRQEILLRRENEVKGGKGDEISSFGTSNGIFDGQGGEDVDESDEEVWEERLWGLKGVLKFLLLLVVLGVSSSYISSMNSSSHSTVVETVRGVKERYLVIREHAHEFVKDLGIVGLDLFGNEEIMGFKFVALELFEEEEMGGEAKMRREVGDSDELNEIDIEEIQRGESESFNMVEVEATELDEFRGEAKDLGSVEVAEIEEEDLDKAQVNGELEGMGIKDGDVNEGQAITNFFYADLLESEILAEHAQEEVDGEDENGDPFHEISTSEVERSLMEEGPMKNMEMQFPIWKAVIAVSFLAITYLLLLGLQLKIRAIKKETSPTVEPCPETVEAEQETPFLACVQEKQHNDQNFAPSVDPKSLNEKCKEISQIRPPSVELLSEFVVGEMISSSLRSSGNKSRIIESEVSSHSLLTTSKGMRSSSSNKAPLQPPFSDTSTSMSTPVFSSTKIKSLSKGMEEGSMEAMKMVATPIRRSSRIRSRTPR